MINFLITLLLFLVDADHNTTAFYEIDAGAAPAISHVTFQTCGDVTVVDAGTFDPISYTKTSTPYELGHDPTTGLYGVKFEQGVPEFANAYYYITLEGEWAQADGYVALKGGNLVKGQRVQGFSLDDALCNPTYVQLQAAKATLNDSILNILCFGGLTIITSIILWFRFMTQRHKEF